VLNNPSLTICDGKWKPYSNFHHLHEFWLLYLESLQEQAYEKLILQLKCVHTWWKLPLSCFSWPLQALCLFTINTFLGLTAQKGWNKIWLICKCANVQSEVTHNFHLNPYLDLTVIALRMRIVWKAGSLWNVVPYAISVQAGWKAFQYAICVVIIWLSSTVIVKGRSKRTFSKLNIRGNCNETDGSQAQLAWRTRIPNPVAIIVGIRLLAAY